jgi:PAS domain S-box-containing protein
MHSSTDTLPPSEILTRYRAEILAHWEQEVRKLPAARSLNERALVDHLPSLLDRIAEMADQLVRGEVPPPPSREAAAHATTRFREGFDFKHVLSELNLLRASIARLMTDQSPSLRAVDEAIDKALVSAAEHFSRLYDQALREARTAARKLESIVLAMVDAVLVADAGGRVVIANDAAVRLFGVPREELLIPLGDFSGRFHLRSPGGEPAVPAAIQALAGESVLGAERVIVVPVSGEERYLRVGAAPLRDEDGAVVGAVVVASDITVRTRMEAELKEIARLREEVLSVVSHDLRNPLGTVRVAADVLLARTEDPTLRRHAQVIQRSAARMERLVADLLDTASIRSGRFSVVPAPCEIAPLLAEAVASCLPAAGEKGVLLEREPFPEGAPVPCDRERVLQVLGNLLGNAVKFCSPGDRVTLRAALEGPELHVQVEDTGPGIAEADLAHVFEPYWSANGQERRGTGLGLFISKGIVAAHRGRIWVQSAPGRGTVFHFTLPAPPGSSAR